MNRILMVIVCLLAAASSAVGQELRQLPKMRAIPMSSSRQRDTALDALQSPAYCDSETLRESATLRAIDGGATSLVIAAGDHGSILRSLDSGQSWETRSCDVDCMLMDTIVLNDRYAVIVGGGFDCVTGISRGVVLISNDGGESWRHGDDKELPRLTLVDAKRTSGKTVLVASGDRDPVSGAKQFRSRDGGRKWEPILGDGPSDVSPERARPGANRSLALARATGINATLRASCNLRDGTWLMAGDHGQILRSTDGGETWLPTREREAATSLLFIAANSDRIPWSLIGREALEKRLRTGIVVAQPHAPSTKALSQAAMRLGATSLDFVDDNERGGLTQTLSDWIEIHRPPVLALDAQLPAEVRSRLLSHAVNLGTQKVVEFSAERRGDSVLHRGALLPDCGALAGDFALDAWMLSGMDLRRAFDPNHQQASAKTRYATGDSRGGGGTLTAGVRLSQGHRLPARRAKASRRLLQIAQARLKQQTAIGELVDRSQDSTTVGDSIDQMLRQTDRPDRFRSACLILARSHGTFSEQTVWDLFADRFAASSAGALASVRNEARQASTEWRQLEQRFSSTAQTQPAPPSKEVDGQLLPIAQASHAAILSPFQTPQDNAVVQASASSPIDPSNVSQPTPAAANEAPVELDLAWQMHPVRLMVEDSLHQKREAESSPESADQLSSPMGNADLRRVSARGGRWSNLIRPQSPQVVRATQTAVRPLLDGKLDEALWSVPAQTQSMSPIRVRVAYDAQFIYFATETQTALFGEPHAPSDSLGTRDADLRSSDRLLLQLDVDRDLFTAFELQFTRDGRTHDSIDGHTHWNPTWYVASAKVGDRFTTELAIERESLNVEIQTGDRWLIEVQAITAEHPASRPWMPQPENRIRVDF
ncbi:MAG: hypothetical protein AAFU85_11215 [Planctomycetota bacterium]